MVNATEPPPLTDRMILEFERPIIDLEKKFSELRGLSTETVDFSAEIRKLEQKARKLQKEVFADLNAQQKVQLARHPARPYMNDYVGLLMDDFIELHGDRGFRDDPAIVGGLAMFDEWEVLVLGHQKGRNTKDNMHRNFGMARPEGYRKATRLMRLASRFRRPIICFIDTPGAYPGIDAEERGQAEAIAYNLREMAGLKVPVVVLVLGEGGSGGALAIGIGDRVLMMENAVYSVITPEGCAAILWKDAGRAPDAAEGLKLTADNLKQFDIIDEIIPESQPWTMPAENDKKAQKAYDRICESIKKSLIREVKALTATNVKTLLDNRYTKFRKMGEWV
jgi:acetyl-CoA carboxylase carboxyl transferase subunit alpha